MVNSECEAQRHSLIVTTIITMARTTMLKLISSLQKSEQEMMTQRKNKFSERTSDVPKVTEQISGRDRLCRQDFWSPDHCSLHSYLLSGVSMEVLTLKTEIKE
jgi:hypothetical protein